MLIVNYLVCLIRGHALISLTHEGLSYKYCLKCGKVETTGHSCEESRPSRIIMDVFD